MRRLIFGTMIAVTCASYGLAQERVRPAKIIEVSRGQAELDRTFFGQVVARETVDLAFQVGGQIVEFPVTEGQEIAKGDLVAKLDQVPYELALSQAQVNRDEAERDLNRFEQLSSAAVSQTTVDDARAALRLSEIALEQARYDIEHATLVAPFDALVASRTVANFTTLSAGTPVVRLHDMSELRIEIDVPEILFQRAGEDPDIEITAKFPASEEVFPLEVREFEAETSAIGQTFRITFGLPRPEGLAILPGSSVTVMARQGSGSGAIEVPPSAIAMDADGMSYVYVFTPGEGDRGAVAKTLVKLGVTASGGMAVEEGLEPGQEIVVSGVAALSDGEIVRRFDGFPE